MKEVDGEAVRARIFTFGQLIDCILNLMYANRLHKGGIMLFSKKIRNFLSNLINSFLSEGIWFNVKELKLPR